MNFTQHKISVIVPVYNVEKYLPQCIESIINQTYKNLEIILIDDGSTDSSGRICDEYAEKDDRIIVIHKENGGLSDARNTGLRKATGDFIGFVDSDDWLDVNMYEVLLETILKNNCDIISCGYCVEYKNKSYKVCLENQVINNKDIIKKYYAEKNVPYAPWMRLYKKYIWKDLEFPKGKIYEDVFVILDSFLKADTIVSISDCLYHYRQRKSSIMCRAFDKSQLDLIEGHKKNLEIISKLLPEYVEKAKKEMLLGERNILLKAASSSIKDEFTKTIILQLQKDIRENFKFILFSNLFTLKSKISFVLAGFNLKLFSECTNINRKRKISNEYYD